MVLDLAAYPVTVGVHFPRHVLFALGQREGNLRVLAARLHRARLKILDDLHESIVDIDKVRKGVRIARMPVRKAC